jgi:DNA-binding CsgD family transcriptional regulator
MDVHNESLLLEQTEIEIIQLLCKQYTTRQIARELDLTKPIIKNHLIDISDKIDKWIDSIIVAYAIEHGIYKPE